MNQPKISIVIPVYNGADYMREAIDSALKQSYSNCEVVVVNDGSSDNGATEAIALSYGDKIRYFSKPNGGVATAFNLGIEQMTGDYFCWLSHDDCYLPDKVRHQVDLIQTLDPMTILYGGYILHYQDQNTRVPIDFSNVYAQEDLNKSLFPVFRGLVNGCTVMIHRSHFQRVGPFDPALRTTQDYNMWFRMLRNTPIHYAGTCDVVMRQHERQGSKVIPAHAEEASRLWIWMDQQLYDFERAELCGTPHLFYQSTSDFLALTPYTEAIEYYRAKASDATPFHATTDLEKDKLIDTLIRNYESLLQQQKSAPPSALRRVLAKGSIGKQIKVAIADMGLLGTIRHGFRILFKKQA